jgi:hypothetical protein
MNVITKMAITTVPINDCRELIRSVPMEVATRRCGTAMGLVAARIGSSAGAIAGGATPPVGATRGRSGKAMGWLGKFMKNLAIQIY